MNSLYTLGLRQTSAVQADLERMRTGEFSVALQGQISASLAALSRTVDDYESMAKREVIQAKQEKAAMRVQKFRSDYSELRTQFERAKTEASNSRLTAQRGDLLASSSASPMSPRNRFGSSQSNFTAQPPEVISESPFQYPPSTRESHALREHSFIQETENQLDNFLAQGREVLDNLVDQKNVLKGTQKRLLSAANTLGLSRDVIGWIEKRSKEDTAIFVVGAIFTFFCFWLIWHYFG